MVHCSRFDDCLQNVSGVLTSSSEGESSPDKLPMQIMDLDDVVSVHAGFANFAGSILSLLYVCDRFVQVRCIDGTYLLCSTAASVIAIIFLRRGALN